MLAEMIIVHRYFESSKDIRHWTGSKDRLDQNFLKALIETSHVNDGDQEM